MSNLMNRMNISEFNDFQDWAHKGFMSTHADADTTHQIVEALLGLSEETGELAALFKRYFRGDHDLYTACKGVLGEAGDVIWYVAVIARIAGWDLSRIIDHNIEKIESRQQRDQVHGTGGDR